MSKTVKRLADVADSKRFEVQLRALVADVRERERYRTALLNLVKVGIPVRHLEYMPGLFVHGGELPPDEPVSATFNQMMGNPMQALDGLTSQPEAAREVDR